MILDVQAVRGFEDMFLLSRYSNAHPSMWFHDEWIDMACSDEPNVAIAAPRGHAKSTKINYAFGLAAALFRAHSFQLKVSKTRGVAVEYIRSTKDELLSNLKIQQIFRFEGLKRDTEDDFIAEFAGGYQFRMMAFGAEQAMRGATWGTRRPDLVTVDDLEDDEQVLNAERRAKLFNWFMNTLLPIGTPHTKFRVIGTILHAESLLQNLLDSDAWTSRRYEGVNDDLSEILWPEMYPRMWWVRKKAQYVEANNLIGFNMEYRNIAVDLTSGFFQRSDFMNMLPEHHKQEHTFYVGGDFAWSQKQRRDKTVLVVGGIAQDGFLDIVDVRRGFFDPFKIIEEIFSIHDVYRPEIWFLESGAVFNTIKAILEVEMRKRQVFLDIREMVPVKEKSIRARPIQTRMRMHTCRFDSQATWYPDMEQEMLQFPRGAHDDHVDAMAWLGHGLAELAVAPLTDDEMEERQVEREKQDSGVNMGRCATTGY